LIKHKIATFFYDSTYGMTPKEVRAHPIADAEKEHIPFLKANMEAVFKVAKYMALEHPKFFWHKYIDTFEKGTDERKKGILPSVVANKEKKGDY
jgi:hypothetical protein